MDEAIDQLKKLLKFDELGNRKHFKFIQMLN